jgi:hypothetical protein
MIKQAVAGSGGKITLSATDDNKAMCPDCPSRNLFENGCKNCPFVEAEERLLSTEKIEKKRKKFESEGDFHFVRRHNNEKRHRKHLTPTKYLIVAIVVLTAIFALLLFRPSFSPVPAPSPSPSPSLSPSTSPVTSPIVIAGRVVGVVAGSVIGENVSGAEIRVIDSKGNEVMINKTNATGVFSFSNLPQGSYTIQIAVPYGYVARSATSYSVTYSRNLEFRLQSLLFNPKTMHYNYTLRGVSSEITFTVYEGMYDYLVSTEDSKVSYVGQAPSPEEI